MKKVLIVVGIIGLIALCWYFFTSTPIKNYPPKGDTIVAFGDSLVQGVGATEGNDFVSVLSRQIGKPIKNSGKSGDTTATALARVGEVLAHDPDIVLVLLGGNDYLRRVPQETTFANLQQIVATLQAKGALVVVLGVRGGLLHDSREAKFAQLAKEMQAAYVPNVMAGLFGNERYMSDAIHPNDLGYQAIADKVLPVVRGVLE
ncbi:MAG: hypothetical protein A2542_03630 [Parcubacteria group bacterium RIFOXYD2_FULL_52_8]|nr:MAG: hypothetical protein A2542_03630 [Parcubacteria group bacterium RIFOXYD2_FULL_52_8]